MLFSPKTRNALFKIFSALCCLIAVYHLVAVFYKMDDSPEWRHLLFSGINLFFAYGIIKRPKYFVYLAALLTIQQYYSHGTYMVNMWVEKKQIHWISVFVLLLLPIGLICLIEDYKIRSKKS